MTVIGELVLAWTGTQPWAAWLVGRLVREGLSGEHLAVFARLDLPMESLLLGLVILALAEVLRSGALLEEERRLTV